jgi:hypothetical protein
LLVRKEFLIMILRTIRFVRLPLLMILLFTIGRFSLGVAGVPYSPRGNAIFSVSSVTAISAIYFGALSGKVGGFGWGGTVLVGVVIGFCAQLLIFTATLATYLGGLNTYFTHWDALNVPEGTVVPMAQAMATRAGGLIAGPITGSIIALIGRCLGGLAPGKASPSA